MCYFCREEDKTTEQRFSFSLLITQRYYREQKVKHSQGYEQTYVHSMTTDLDGPRSTARPLEAATQAPFSGVPAGPLFPASPLCLYKQSVPFLPKYVMTVRIITGIAYLYWVLGKLMKYRCKQRFSNDIQTECFGKNKC